MTKEEIKETIRKHQIWLVNKVGGERADFKNVNLTHANLTEVNLAYANLTYANLTHVNLSYANLIYANLTHANLIHANLTDAYLASANLTRACLHGANLTRIKTNHLTIGVHPAPEGELIGWGKKNEKLVKLLIPAEAKRSCATTRKHRAEFAKILWVEDDLTRVIVENSHGGKTIYKVGQTVYCHKWEENRWEECAGGIHFFLSRKEAEAWQ